MGFLRQLKAFLHGQKIMSFILVVILALFESVQIKCEYLVSSEACEVIWKVPYASMLATLVLMVIVFAATSFGAKIFRGLNTFWKILLFVQEKPGFKNISFVVPLQLPFALASVAFLAIWFMKVSAPAQFAIYWKFFNQQETGIGILVLFFVGLAVFFRGLVKYFLNGKETIAIRKSMKFILLGIATNLLIIPLILGFTTLLRHNETLLFAAFSVGLLLVLYGLIGLCVYLFRARGTDNIVLKETAKYIFFGAIDVILMIGLWFGLSYLQPQLQPSCFPEETLVSTPSGNVPIGLLQEHDIIYAYDTQSSMIVEATVEHVIYKTRTELLTIDGDLQVTPEHPMAVLSEDNIFWKEAGELSVGECLVSEAGSCVNIKSITKQNPVSPIPVINLSVSAPNNFFVIMGGEMVLVHNKTMVPPYLI